VAQLAEALRYTRMSESRGKDGVIGIFHSFFQWARTSTFTRFLDHTQRCTTIGRTSLEE
jgi:hypothetical protein